MTRLLAALFALLLGACSQGPTMWYTQGRPDATPFDQARKVCFERTFGAPTAEAENAFRGPANRACMREMGWEDRRTVF